MSGESLETLNAEIKRLQAAKRRALALADARAKQANEMRAQLAELRRVMGGWQ
jgi:hypothetical protein